MSNSDDNSQELDGEMENGHLSPVIRFQLSSSSASGELEDTTDEEEVQGTNVQFDTEIPTNHRYLGKLNHVGGYTLYDEGDIRTMLALHTETLVFPGFILPLVLNNPSENSVMQNFIESNKVFVLLCGNQDSTKFFDYGVTMEIFETQKKYNVLNIKARGRQRCKVIPGSEIKTVAGRIQQVTVQILPEPPLNSPLDDTQMLSLKAKRPYTSLDYDEMKRNDKYRRYHLCQYPFASWIYDRNEICYYVKQILDRLSNYVREYIPNDPVKLSYWFVQNYQLQHEERLYIMMLNSTLERLKLELKYLKMKRKICCASCGENFCEPCHVFAMSKDGVQSNYVNPGGRVFETVTVNYAKNYRLVGSSSKDFSWFPGYAWTIMECQECSLHIGWKFTSPHLKPNSFYGLSKSGFKILRKHDLVVDEETDAAIDNFRTSFTPGFHYP